MKDEYTLGIAFMIFFSWMAGVALANGWMTAVAVVFPPYAWYLVVERILQLLNFLP